MSDERIVVNIDADVSGFNRQLDRADARLGTFNKRVVEGNKVVNAFSTQVKKSATAISAATTAANNLRTTIISLSAAATRLNTSLQAIDRNAKTAAGGMRTLGREANAAGNRIEALGVKAQAAGNTLTSLNRRAGNLATTVSGLNAVMRQLTRTQTATIDRLNAVSAAAIRASGAVSGAGRSATTTAGKFALLNRQTHGLVEGFRRGVAQLTALRTLVYQGLFWFSPLIYSVIKVNMEYEKQMVLLRNMAKATEQNAKAQEAIQTRKTLLNLAQTNPFGLQNITDAFVKMRVGGVEPLEGKLQTLMDSIAAFGGDNNSLQRASVAIQQMGGKGVISMEELRQQMGEHIPTAMRAMSVGMGLEMGKMLKIIEQGKLESTESLKQMFAVLLAENSGAAKRMMETWPGLIARLGTAWQNFIVKVTTGSEAGDPASPNSFVGRLKGVIEEFIIFLKTPEGVNFALQIQNAMVGVLNAFIQLIKYLYRNRELIVDIAKTVAVLWGGRMVKGIITNLIAILLSLNSHLLKVGMAMRAFGKAFAAANVASATFATRMRAGTAAMFGFATATSRTNGLLSVLRMRALLAFGAIAALVGIIWAAVAALNAKNAAEGREIALQEAKEGKTWEEGERETAKNEIAKLQLEVDTGKQALGNGATLHAGGVPLTASQLAAKEAELKSKKETFNITEQNTNTASTFAQSARIVQNESQRYDSTIQGLQIKGVQLRDGKDAKVQQNITRAQLLGMAGVADAEVERLRQAASGKGVTAGEKEGYNQLIAQRLSEAENYRNSANDLTGGPNLINKEDDGDGGSGSKRDPLERYRNRFENEFMQGAELQLEYENLRDNTARELDREEVQANAEILSARAKSEAQLKQMIATQQEYQDSLKNSILVQKAIIKLTDEAAQSNINTSEGFDALERGYDSIIAASQSYRDALGREYREELAILEARMRDNVITEDETKQYKELKTAIEEAVRAKEAEMLLEKAKQADELNRQYDYSFLGEGEVERIEKGRSILEYQEMLTLAYSKLDTFREQLDETMQRYGDIQASLAEAKLAGDTSQIEKLETETETITVQATKLAETVNLHERAIPFIQRRIDILQEELRVLDKWGGAGVSLLRWAKEANRRFEDLGRTIGDNLTSAMDGFIDGLAEGEFRFKDFVKSILSSLYKIIIQALIAKAVLNAIGLGNSSTFTGAELSGQISAGQSFAQGGAVGLHSGGIVGREATFRRSVDSGLFAFAQRYHGGGMVGLGANEVPIIAERGEGVFTKEQMAALGRGGGNNNVQVNVINQTGTEAEVQREAPRFDGEKWIEQIILKKMSKPGPVRDALRNGSIR